VDGRGDSVRSWKGGERVMGLVAGGAYAEQVITHERAVVPVPEGMSDTDAAAIPEAFITAHDALVSQGGMMPGDLVLVHAVAGGVGSAAVQLVHLWGASPIGTAGSDAKLEAIARIVSFFPVNYRKEDFHHVIEDAFGPHTVDLVLDVVGAAYWERNLSLLRDRGALVLVGLMGGAKAMTPLGEILRRRLRIMGTVLRPRPLEEKIAATKAFARQVLPHLAQGRLMPVVDSVFPFAQLHEATMRMERNENTGKIVLRM
jgi:NADPH:quinone reductase-like Zn-dependent oxidoreductase